MAVATDIIKNYDKINWKATFRALIQSAFKSKPKKKRVAAPAVEGAPVEVAAATEPVITPAPRVHPVSEDAEIEEWLNRISERASKTSARNASKSSSKSTKSTTVTKKAAPKSANSRSKKK
jgi:hypothetical protein